jgi:hypothetical protein
MHLFVMSYWWIGRLAVFDHGMVSSIIAMTHPAPFSGAVAVAAAAEVEEEETSGSRNEVMQ